MRTMLAKPIRAATAGDIAVAEADSVHTNLKPASNQRQTVHPARSRMAQTTSTDQHPLPASLASQQYRTLACHMTLQKARTKHDLIYNVELLEQCDNSDDGRTDSSGDSASTIDSFYLSSYADCNNDLDRSRRKSQVRLTFRPIMCYTLAPACFSPVSPGAVSPGE